VTVLTVTLTLLPLSFPERASWNMASHANVFVSPNRPDFDAA
jgi:hypothetical protein